MKKELLAKPFGHEQVRTRPGHNGKSLSYVETHAVIARLNEVADFEWSFDIIKHEILDDEVIVLGKLTIDGVTKMAFGGSSVTRDNSGKDVSLADDLKSAASDCTKKCASLFGIGLELYGAGIPAPAAEREPRAPAPRADDRLTSRQLAALHAACRRRGWPSHQLTTLIGEKYGKNAPQALTRSEASALISELSSLNGH